MNMMYGLTKKETNQYTVVEFIREGVAKLFQKV